MASKKKDKKNPTIAAAEGTALPGSVSSGGLNSSDSLGLVGLIVTVLTLVLKISTWFKVFLLIGGAGCCVVFLETSTWMRRLPRRWRHILSGVLLLTLVVIGVPQILHEQAEQRPPDFSWMPYKLAAANGESVALSYDGKTSQDLILIFQGKVIDRGGPSVTARWEAKLSMPDDTVTQLATLLVPRKEDEERNLRIVEPGGNNALLPFGPAYLPEITASDPVPAGGAKSGFVVFIFHQWNYSKNPRTLVGARVVLSFYDILGKQCVYEYSRLPAPDTDVNPTESIPGMPKPN